MLSSDIILGLYVNHPVELLLQNGQLRRGEMTAYNSAAGTLCLDGESVSVSELADIRYCGSVAPTFYKSSADEYLVDSSYRFTLANLEDAAAAQLFLYDEFAFSLPATSIWAKTGFAQRMCALFPPAISATAIRKRTPISSAASAAYMCVRAVKTGSLSRRRAM